MNTQEHEVYSALLRAAQVGELGNRFPLDGEVVIHHVTIFNPDDTKLSFKPVPPLPDGYRDIISTWKSSWPEPIDLSGLKSSGVRTEDIMSTRWPGCKVAFSHVGFDDSKTRAVGLIHYGCDTADKDYARELIVFLSRSDRSWEIIEYRILKHIGGYK
jgi:hypothetical protein